MDNEGISSLHPAPRVGFRLPSECSIPGLYVSDFYVLRSLKDPSKQIQRHVKLRRGLNILWADPNPPEKVGSKSKVAGHTAGKSTFCRLLRYALGDTTYGTPKLTQKITDKFPDGWIVLGVEVEGHRWLVGRSLMDKADSFALEGKSLNDLPTEPLDPRVGFDVFQTLLDQKFVSVLGRETFPGQNERIRWRDLLPWLTRDQEARLLSLTTWRAPVGKAQGIATDTDQRQFLIRLVLGLLTTGEASEIDRHEKLARDKAKLETDLPISAARMELAFEQLSEHVSVSAPNLEGELLLDAAKRAVKSKAGEVAGMLADIPTAQVVNKALVEWQEGIQTAATAQQEYRSEMRNASQLRKQAASCEATRITQKSRLEDMQREAPANVCGVPIGEACETGKCHKSKQPTTMAQALIIKALDEQVEELQADYETAQAQVEILKAKWDAAKTAEKELEKAYAAISSERQAKLEKYHEESARQSTREFLLRSTESVVGTWSKKTGEKEGKAKDIRESAKTQEAQRKTSAPERVAFSDLFNLILRRMLGNEVTGTVEPDGRALELTATGRNDLESGAITAAKIISFDLAAMVWSMEGKGHHPRFLIHDSPKEADMAADIYDGLFEVAHALESYFPAGTEPNFQYIVTTTATPPDYVRKKPWLLDPILNALVPSKRILGVDL